VTLTERPPIEQTERVAPVRTSIAKPQLVAGGVLVLIGVLWLLERMGTIDVTVTATLALATMVVGIALMLLAGDGPHGGLVVFGTILGVAALATAVAPFEGFQGGVGDRTIVVTSIETIQPDYNVSMGTLTIDLRELDDLEAVTELSARVGMGELVIRVPSGIDVAVEARVGAGQIEIFGEMTDGVGIDASYESPGLKSDSPRLALDLEVFTGRVEVTR
jgi:hypothetical protein